MMALVLISSRCIVVFSVLALAAVLSLDAVSQEPAPAPQAAPQPTLLQNPVSAGQLAFLSAYAGRTTKDLLKDKQFHALIKATIPHTEYHYGRDMSLTEALDDVLSGSPLPVNVRDGRYVTVMGM